MLIVGPYVNMISKLKEELSKSFGMKVLDPMKQILDVDVNEDWKNKKLWLL